MVGQRIGNYRVIRQLGEGGMGVVYEAIRDDIGSRSAVKVLRPEFALRPETAARFFNEARATKLRRRNKICAALGNALGQGAPFSLSHAVSSLGF